MDLGAGTSYNMIDFSIFPIKKISLLMNSEPTSIREFIWFLENSFIQKNRKANFLKIQGLKTSATN